MTEFDQDKTIEPGQLDVEACRQAEVFFKWAERSVAARAEVDRQKFDLETLAARLEFQVREAPEKFGLAKVTEAAIHAAVIVHKSYIEASQALLRAQEQAALLDKCVQAMDQRKRMIEILVTLHGQEYFAGPSVPHDLVAAWQDYRQRSSEAVVEKQKEMARRRVRRED